MMKDIDMRIMNSLPQMVILLDDGGLFIHLHIGNCKKQASLPWTAEDSYFCFRYPTIPI